MACKNCSDEGIFCKGVCKICYYKEWAAKRDKNMSKKVREYRKEQQRKWRSENKERIKEQYKKWVAKNKEQVREQVRNWQKSKRGKILCRKNNHKRRALLKNSLFSLTIKDIDRIFERDIGCVYCNSLNSRELDHIIPISKGGSTIFNNMVLACRYCNCSKGNKDVFSWCKSKKIIVPKIVISLLLGVEK